MTVGSGLATRVYDLPPWPRRLTAGLYFLALNWLLLAPADSFEQVPELLPHQDKIVHGALFAALAFLVRWSLAAWNKTATVQVMGAGKEAGIESGPAAMTGAGTGTGKGSETGSETGTGVGVGTGSGSGIESGTGTGTGTGTGRGRRNTIVLVSLLTYAAAIEALQPLIGGAGRQFDWLDLAFNLAGTALGWLLCVRIEARPR